MEKRKKDNHYPTTSEFTLTAYWTNPTKTLFSKAWFILSLCWPEVKASLGPLPLGSWQNPMQEQDPPSAPFEAFSEPKGRPLVGHCFNPNNQRKLLRGQSRLASEQCGTSFKSWCPSSSPPLNKCLGWPTPIMAMTLALEGPTLLHCLFLLTLKGLVCKWVTCGLGRNWRLEVMQSVKILVAISLTYTTRLEESLDWIENLASSSYSSCSSLFSSFLGRASTTTGTCSWFLIKEQIFLPFLDKKALKWPLLVLPLRHKWAGQLPLRVTNKLKSINAYTEYNKKNEGKKTYTIFPIRD